VQKGVVGNSIFKILAYVLVIFHIYTALFGIIGSTEQRAVHLALASALVFIAIKPDAKRGKKWFDWVLFVGALASAGYVFIRSDYLGNRMQYVTDLSALEMALGIIGIIVLIEAARRLMGWTLPIVVIIFIVYALTGQHIPGKLGHSGFDLMWIVDHIYYTPSGVFGVPLGVSATFVAIFIIFGAFLSATGGGQFFTNFASAAMGGFRGGPAKISVIASMLFGMICGAASGNVATTGSVTIPLMKKTGYEKHFAGAVEATASTGGEIMPPVMGAGAFILAQMAAIPYRTLCFAAIIPAILYYIAIYISIDLEAVRMRLKGMPKSELPPAWPILKKGWIYLVPIAIMLYMILSGSTPIKAGAYALVANLVLCYLRKSTWVSLKTLRAAMEDAAVGLGVVAVACAVAGILVGIMSLTDFGLKLTQLVAIISQGHLFIALILAMIVAIILGMGMPPSAAYIVEAVLVAPALTNMGLPPLIAHLFIFYFTVLSAITPPVAVASFTAAGIAGGNPMKVGWIAFRMALPGMIVPFMFVYSPGLVLMNTPINIAIAVVTSVCGVAFLAIGLAGHLHHKLPIIPRILMLVGALFLVAHGWIFGLIGFIMAVLGYFLYRLMIKNKNGPSLAA